MSDSSLELTKENRLACEKKGKDHLKEIFSKTVKKKEGEEVDASESDYFETRDFFESEDELEGPNNKKLDADFEKLKVDLEKLKVDFRDAYLVFWGHNIVAIAENAYCKEEGVCAPSEQRLHFMSKSSEAIIAQNYPPASECGYRCNISFTRQAEKEGFEIKSSCQFKMAAWCVKYWGCIRKI